MQDEVNHKGLEAMFIFILIRPTQIDIGENRI